MIRLAIACLLAAGCGGTSAAPPAAKPVANTATTPSEPAVPEACRKPPSEDKSMAGPGLLVIYCAHVHATCACRDQACAEERDRAYHSAKEAFYEKHPNQSRDLSSDDKQFMDPLIMKMAECYRRLRGPDPE